MITLLLLWLAFGPAFVGWQFCGWLAYSRAWRRYGPPAWEGLLCVTLMAATCGPFILQLESEAP